MFDPDVSHLSLLENYIYPYLVGKTKTIPPGLLWFVFRAKQAKHPMFLIHRYYQGVLIPPIVALEPVFLHELFCFLDWHSWSNMLKDFSLHGIFVQVEIHWRSSFNRTAQGGASSRCSEDGECENDYPHDRSSISSNILLTSVQEKLVGGRVDAYNTV
jgi:hypothetical protein